MHKKSVQSYISESQTKQGQTAHKLRSGNFLGYILYIHVTCQIYKNIYIYTLAPAPPTELPIPNDGRNGITLTQVDQTHDLGIST